MAHLIRHGVVAHEFTRDDRSKGGRAKAAKYAGEVAERRRRKRRARYLRERSGQPLSFREQLERSLPMPPDPDARVCKRCGGVSGGLVSPQERSCACTGWERLGWE